MANNTSTSLTRTDTNSVSPPLCRGELRQSQIAHSEAVPCASAKSRSHPHGALETRSNLLKL